MSERNPEKHTFRRLRPLKLCQQSRVAVWQRQEPILLIGRSHALAEKPGAGMVPTCCGGVRRLVGLYRVSTQRRPMGTNQSNTRWLSHKARRHGREFARRASVSVALIALISLDAHVYAATVNALQGQVLVNSGQGYRLVDGSIQLAPGATVVANPGAVAQVVYPNGCTVTVQPGSVYLIASQEPCPAMAREQVQTNQANPSKRSESTTETGGRSGLSPTTLALGAAVIGAGGAAAYFLLFPASP